MLNVQSHSPDAIAVFDIGGTWFRSGIWTSWGGLESVSRQPAASFKTYPDEDIESLQARLVAYLVTEANRLSGTARHSVSMAAVSMGAAMDARNGTLLNNGPLWGSKSAPMDLAHRLNQVAPALTWTVLNDVSASLLCYARLLHRGNHCRISLVTISTGIASRTFDYDTYSIPTGRSHGLQGEIGHIPVKFQLADHSVERYCDCGGKNHMNAFSSGRGIEAILASQLSGNETLDQLSAAMHSDIPSAPNELGNERANAFTRLVHRGFEPARKVLDDLTSPIASAVTNLLTFDPLVERVILVGGVVDGLGDDYRRSILRNLELNGLYQVLSRDSDFYSRVVVMEPRIAYAGLIGAGIAAISDGDNARNSIRSRLGPFQRRVRARRSADYVIAQVENAEGFERALDNLEQNSEVGVPQTFIIDAEVYALHERRFEAFKQSRKSPPNMVLLDLDEKTKSLAAVSDCLEIFEEVATPRRRSPVVAIGGGVLLDVVGTATGLYRRGVDCIRVPTTLLAQVDASVGVKVGVNFASVKNRIGMYSPPLLSVVDPSFLTTLPERELRSGMAEMIKIAVMCDAALFAELRRHGVDMLRENFQGARASLAIRSSIENMVNELEPNLWEASLVRPADFGHTFGPKLELALPGNMLHGESVAIDMAISVLIGEVRGVTHPSVSASVLDLLVGLQFMLDVPDFDTAILMRALKDAENHRGGRQHLPVPVEIGKVRFIENVSVQELEVALERLRGISGLRG